MNDVKLWSLKWCFHLPQESEIAVEVKQSNPVKVEDQELLDLPKLTDDDESSSSGASSIGCTDNTARVGFSLHFEPILCQFYLNSFWT